MAGEPSTANGSQKVALITGITGQDGSYLAELLLGKGYEVHGILRRSSSFNTGRIQHLYGQPALHTGGHMHLHYGDLTDTTCLISIISKVRPKEIYNLGAQSHVKISFEMSEYTTEVDAVGALRLLEAVRVVGMEQEVRIFQAATSEMYGKVLEVPQNEDTPFYPRSPYACAKLYAFWIMINYREAYGIYTCNGIMFNHESPRRGENFVTRKITRAVAKITLGLMEHVELGNLDSKRDWGHAKDYVQAMWLMLQKDLPDDYVVAMGETHSVREFVECAFGCVGRQVEWRGSGSNEKGVDASTGEVLVKVNPKYFRPTEAELLLGDPRKAKAELGWKPQSSFEEIVKEMVEADLELMRRNPEA